MSQFILIPALLLFSHKVMASSNRFRIPSISRFVERYEQQLIRADRSTAIFEEPERVIAIGDTHGDFAALVQILSDRNLIDQNQDWIGGNSFLVQTGDFMARGDHSRKSIDLFRKLQLQSEYSGGKVIVLLGNHESYFIRGEHAMISFEDAASFLDLVGSPRGTQENLTQALTFAASDSSIYGQWIADLPVAVQIGRRLYVHAGVEAWLQDLDIDRLNATVRAWMRHFQNPDQNPSPSKKTYWVLGPKGPLQTRTLAKGAVPVGEFSKWLENKNLEAVVVGHTKVKDFEAMTNNLKYGNRLIMLDTGISSAARGGLPSSVEINRGQAPVAKVLAPAQFCSQHWIQQHLSNGTN